VARSDNRLVAGGRRARGYTALWPATLMGHRAALATGATRGITIPAAPLTAGTGPSYPAVPLARSAPLAHPTPPCYPVARAGRRGIRPPLTRLTSHRVPARLPVGRPSILQICLRAEAVRPDGLSGTRKVMIYPAYRPALAYHFGPN
jgi:hypothetical protein